MIQLLAGDARDVLPTLAADSVQCVVTSPPYYGLRDYGTAQWDGGDAACQHSARMNHGDSSHRPGNGGEVFRSGARYIHTGNATHLECRCGATRIDRQIGLEENPEAYLATMVAVFREVRRVMRPDATCWINLGDSYNANQGTAFDTNRDGGGRKNFTMSPKVSSGGLAPKQLLMMPARLALALQADGWWLRSDIIWHKPNPMPESCRDRPTSAHEHVFLLTKRSRYFYDADAVREEAEYGFRPTRGGNIFDRVGNGASEPVKTPGVVTHGGDPSTGRNLRNVWTIATHAYPQAHFATYPPELAERCIRAGTSERGACSQCGAPWGRVTDVERHATRPGNPIKNDASRKDSASRCHRIEAVATTTGWAPGCKCEAGIVPCRVLDPFFGAGTTGLVSDRLGRDCIGIDLNPDYNAMSRARIEADCPLFTSFPPAETDAQDERMRDLFRDAAD